MPDGVRRHLYGENRDMETGGYGQQQKTAHPMDDDLEIQILLSCTDALALMKKSRSEWLKLA